MKDSETPASEGESSPEAGQAGGPSSGAAQAPIATDVVGRVAAGDRYALAELLRSLSTSVEALGGYELAEEWDDALVQAVEALAAPADEAATAGALPGGPAPGIGTPDPAVLRDARVEAAAWTAFEPTLRRERFLHFDGERAVSGERVPGGAAKRMALQAFARLDRDTRALLWARYIEGESTSQLAHKDGRSIFVVERELLAARESLRCLLELGAVRAAAAASPDATAPSPEKEPATGSETAAPQSQEERNEVSQPPKVPDQPLTDADLLALLEGGMASGEPVDDAVLERAEKSPQCAAELSAWRALRAAVLAQGAPDGGAHPAPAKLIAYADDEETLGVVARTEIEAHLTQCPTCRDELRAMRRIKILAKSPDFAAAAAAERAAQLAIEDAIAAATLSGDAVPDFSEIPAPQAPEEVRSGRTLMMAAAVLVAAALPVVGLMLLDRRIPMPDVEERGARDEIVFDRGSFTATKRGEEGAMRSPGPRFTLAPRSESSGPLVSLRTVEPIPGDPPMSIAQGPTGDSVAAAGPGMTPAPDEPLYSPDEPTLADDLAVLTAKAREQARAATAAEAEVLPEGPPTPEEFETLAKGKEAPGRVVVKAPKYVAATPARDVPEVPASPDTRPTVAERTRMAMARSATRGVSATATPAKPNRAAGPKPSQSKAGSDPAEQAKRAEQTGRAEKVEKAAPTAKRTASQEKAVTSETKKPQPAPAATPAEAPRVVAKAARPNLSVDGTPVTSREAKRAASEYGASAKTAAPVAPAKPVQTAAAAPAPQPAAEVSTRPLTALERLRMLGGLGQAGQPSEPAPSAPTQVASTTPQPSSGPVWTDIRDVEPKTAAAVVPTNAAAGVPTNAAAVVPTNAAAGVPTNAAAVVPTNAAAGVPTSAPTAAEATGGDAQPSEGFIAGVREIDPETAARAAAEARFLARERAIVETDLPPDPVPASDVASIDADDGAEGPRRGERKRGDGKRAKRKQKLRDKQRKDDAPDDDRSRLVEPGEIVVVDGRGPDAADADAPSFSSTGGVVTPEELLAMLGAQQRSAESSEAVGGERGASEPAVAVARGRRAGASIIEMQPDRSVARKSAAPQAPPSELPADAMIAGVRDVGRTGLPSAPPPTFSQGASIPATSVAVANPPVGPIAVRFARGAAQVLDMDDVAGGIKVELLLPVVDGQAQPIDVKIGQAGTDRELRQIFQAPRGHQQSAPTVTFNIPADWLRPGRFSVELRTPSMGANPARRMNLRILDGGRTSG